jgi:acetyltransferase-like isoleucine patch superfamily enzyme
MLLQPVIHGEESRLHLGQRTDVNDTVFNTMSGEIFVGDFTFFGHGCQVLTGRHDVSIRDLERKEHPASGFDVHIGQGVWVGSGAIILSGVHIADHAVIAAGSVVTRDCNEAGIYGGNPASLIRKIDFVKE